MGKDLVFAVVGIVCGLSVIAGGSADSAVVFVYLFGVASLAYGTLLIAELCLDVIRKILGKRESERRAHD